MYGTESLGGLYSAVNWTMTIADVAAQMYDAQSYCKLIEQHYAASNVTRLLRKEAAFFSFRWPTVFLL